MKKIFKKIRVLSTVLFSIVLVVAVFGCGGEQTAHSRQDQIAFAAAGSTVTLDASFTDTTIRINKALTVNGNNISNLNVIVDSNVRNNVTLKNFPHANITIDSSSRMANSSRMARTAGATAGDDLKKLGDDAVPLFLENCTINKIDAESDFALYLEPGEDKTVITELNLKEGLENFTFAENDKTNTATNAKSQVAKLNIEDGVEKINLIGGTFNDVDLADDFTGSVDFKYDKEFVGDQLNFDDVDAFFADAKIDEKDVAIADKTEPQLSGVWKIALNAADLNLFNGYVSIAFLKQSQISKLSGPNGNWAPFTKNEPIYCLTHVGDFKYDATSNATLRTLYGSEDCIWTPSGLNEYGDMEFEQVNFNQYPNYAKESVIVKVENSTVTYYVNLDVIKKTDLLIGANAAGEEPIGAPGLKVSDVDLAGYKPYFAVDWARFCAHWNSSQAVANETEFTVDPHAMNSYEYFADGAHDDNGNYIGSVASKDYNHITSPALSPSNLISLDEGRPVYIPVSESVQLVNGMPEFLFFPMTDASSEGYPNVSAVEYSNINVSR